MLLEVTIVVLGLIIIAGGAIAVLRTRSKYTLGANQVLVVERNGKFERLIEQPGVHWLNGFSEQARIISLEDKERKVKISGKPNNWTLEFQVAAFTQEFIEATIELSLHLEMEKADEPGHVIYEVYKRVIGICESSCRDLVSTIALGKIREDRRNLQTNLKIEMAQELSKIKVRLQKVIIAPSIRFPQEVENALKKEMEIMLQKRAVLAEENHKNEIMVRAAETEAENRTRLATADARNIQRVGIALDGNRSEAARYILLMRFLHEMSRLDSSAANDNVHKPYLELLRELMTDIEPVVIKEDPKTTTTTTPTPPPPPQPN